MMIHTQCTQPKIQIMMTKNMISKIPVFLIAFFLLSAAALQAADSLLFGPEEDLQIVVNNQILAKVNGKAISVFDVMKKMDMLFYRQFPEYTSSIQARYQFYLVSWKRVLQDLVDKELIMADAEESKMQVSGGDIRQEMEQLFGPNVHANLDKVGLSFDEAYKMVHSDIVLKRMLYLRAHVKALKHVTPQVIRKAYEEYAEANIIPAQWTYAVISIRDSNPTQGAEAANHAYRLLTEENLPMAKLKKKMSQISFISPTTSINLSEEIQNKEEELSPSYKEILSKLSSHSYSQPIAQKSRQDGATVFRIFYLKEITPSRKVPLAEVENQIKDKLLDEVASKETQAYIKKLRKHFDVQDNTKIDTVDFTPFSLN
jgi:hypothetical protein